MHTMQSQIGRLLEQSRLEETDCFGPKWCFVLAWAAARVEGKRSFADASARR